MLLWAAAFGLLVAPTVWAQSRADDGLGLDFGDEVDAGMDQGADRGDGFSVDTQGEPIAAGGPTDLGPDSEPRFSVDTEGEPVAAGGNSDLAEEAILERELDGRRPEMEAPVREAAASELGDEAVASDVRDAIDEAALQDASGGVDDIDIDDAPDTAMDDVSPADAAGAGPAPSPAAAAGSRVAIGPMGIDGEGRTGRIHTVARGDTLWDISAAYLGTPWVWPSVWNDNEGISNPHRIAPGDRIWITAGEMRIVTEEQADQLISGVPDEVATTDAPFEEDVPTSLGDEDELLEASAPTSMEELPVAAPTAPTTTSRTGAMVRVSEAESLGFVSPDTIKAATSIVDTPEMRVWLAEGDRIYIGLGEGNTQVGDEYTIYRDFDEVRDLDGTLLGYHVAVLGWAVVRATDAESSVAEIRQSQYEIRKGDMVIPRDPVVVNVPVKLSPDALPGHIIYLPDSRTVMGDGEWVYLDRGSLHGVEPGTEIEVYIPGKFIKEDVTGKKVLTPDDVIGQMIVVDTQPDSSVAYIVHAERSLEVGDKVRPIAPKVAQR
jgi:hypothetical protein